VLTAQLKAIRLPATVGGAATRVSEVKALLTAIGSICEHNIRNRAQLREHGGIEKFGELLASTTLYCNALLNMIHQICESDYEV